MTGAGSSTPRSALGPPLAIGRDAAIFPLGAGRVLRRTHDGRAMQREATAMEYVRAAGYPVPAVHRVGSGEIELDRVDGPTMLADLLTHPWRLPRYAHVLADLHQRLHAIPAPPWFPVGPVPGDAVVHLDLHPGNIILSRTGPVVVDWPHAARGSAASDVALTWTSLACFEHDATGFKTILADWFRAAFLTRFLASAGREVARPLVPAIVGYRLAHPQRSHNVRPGEVRALQRLALTPP